MTIRPEMTAFVVAIAGMILPAIAEKKKNDKLKDSNDKHMGIKLFQALHLI